ncbi:hypothetical protein BP6252_07571 [Coleophoma cylindrospora]|uniref:Uncharacterized protein n=1 Tax=Coleophoma cylindrospora TaxID=1849047 RepID=A0A3D8RAR3_9HELO|nr:hypothetical protein BP6252_07571 [Coleophoma cylindrospora]
MDKNIDYYRHPAKRPRLENALDGPQLRQSLYPTQSGQPNSYLPSSSAEQEATSSASYVVSTTGSHSFSQGLSDFGGQWMLSMPQASFRAESQLSTAYYPSHTTSVWQHQDYARQVPLTYLEHPHAFMQPPPQTLSPLCVSDSVGHGTWISSAPPHLVYAGAPLLDHARHHNSLISLDQHTFRSDLISTGELSYHGLEFPQLDAVEEPKDIGIEVVCFGMIPNIVATYEGQSASDIPSTFSVQIESSSRFTAQGGFQIEGRILTEYGEMIQGLIDEPTLTLHITCMTNEKPAAKKHSRRFEPLSCVLEITVYGPLEIFEDIGTWFQGHEIYLQDPRSCHMDVRYCNPQRLSAHDLDSCSFLSEVVPKFSVLDLQDVTHRDDPLDILSSRDDLEEALQPSIIQVSLKRHQKQALTFMLRREEGWGYNNGQPDIWEKADTGKGRMFINTVSDAYQAEEPPQFYGGIIADPMGLGKTLTMIALVATDVDTIFNPRDMVDYNKIYTSATLVIMPPPLLGSWEEQIAEHVADGSLMCRRHHGQTKLANPNELDHVDIVLTTYHTVSAEFRSESFSGRSILFQVCWRRIILDEAHFIRNGNSKMARAVCNLDSVARWAVTGTPIQNRLGDLVPLLNFIRVYPYDDPQRFDADISQFWKSGQDQSAIQRLQRLSSCLLLRRAKGTINLPPRRDFLLPVELTHEERVVYNRLREQTIIKVDEALNRDHEASETRGYVNVLQQIESLRLFCNLGLQYHSRPEIMLQSSDWSKVAQSTFNTQIEMHSMICAQCSSIIDAAESLLDDVTTQREQLYFSCSKIICIECLSDNRRSGRKSVCGHRPSCPAANVCIGGTVIESVSALAHHQTEPQPNLTSLPSKIEALIKDLKTVPSSIKCIVFSSWRLTLDYVERGLDQASLRSIRFDGKVPQKDRQGVINKFRTDPSVRVMLLTLSCGAVGLTLTAASRAYLMEPHWNPTLEEQALARIYRLGQTREVTTVRLYVKDSFEEQVMQLQESKKRLASVLLSPHDGDQADNSLRTLEVGTS